MRKESFHIAIACFIGTALGLLVAFKLAEMFAIGRYLWFLGAFLGAGVAYLAYDPMMVWNAAKRAWRELADGERVTRFLYSTLSVSFVTSEVLFLVAVIIAGIVVTYYGGVIGFAWHLWGSEVGEVWLLGACVSFLCSMGAMALTASSSPGKPPLPLPQEPLSTVSFRVGLRMTTLFINPVSLPILLAAGCLFFLWKVAYGLAWLAWRTSKALWRVTVFAARLLFRVFVLIHSTERVVCFVDTALGVAVAYTQVSPTLTGIFAGGLIGLAFGVLNYEIFSVRILKLAPARARK